MNGAKAGTETGMVNGTSIGIATEAAVGTMTGTNVGAGTCICAAAAVKASTPTVGVA